jgi:acetyl esterase/lipase
MMISWQGRLLKVFFRIQRLLKPPPAVLDVAAARAELDAMGARFGRSTKAQRTAVDAGGVRAEWLDQPGVATDLVVLYFHGGFYRAGSLDSHRHLAAGIATASGARALTVDYRLAPEHRFPAAVEDATAAYRWLLASGVAPSQTVMAGDSAGGGLVVATMVSLRDAGQPLPAAGVLLSPWTDLSLSGESWRTKANADLIIDIGEARQAAPLYLGDADPRTPLASPLFAELAGLPPLLIQVGSDEVLLSDATELALRARAAGGDASLEVWDGMGHVWHFVASFLPEGKHAIDRIGDFIRGAVAQAQVQEA